MGRVILYEVNHVIDIDKINDDSVIIDAGAAIGRFVEEFRKQDNAKNCKVICVESSKSNFTKLAGRKLENTETIHGALVGTKQKDITFTEFKGDPKGDGNHRYHLWGNVVGIYKDIVVDGTKVTEYKVPAYTLKDIMDEYKIDHIDYLKMDIEGAEYDVLFNIDQKLSDKISQISIEVHDDKQNNKLIGYLESLGFTIEKYNHNEFFANKL